LPPVVKSDEADLLNQHYATPYFFSSQALAKTQYVSIELKQVYRQTDSSFIQLLNRIRDHDFDQQTLKQINQRYLPDFRPSADQPCITLTATNAVAQQINRENLSRLAGKPRIFEAVIEGEFSPSAYPTDERFECKVGAQIMFVRNDTEGERRFFNGKLGQIVGFDDENQSILIRCPDDPTDIAVARFDWQNIRYRLDETTREIKEEILGVFTQFPLKLAWAITIHKSQGLTFDRAIIDAQQAFAHGQVYVALSRCRTFEGIVLRSPILSSSVKTDATIQEYCQAAHRQTPSLSQLEQAKRDYQVQQLQELFSFAVIRRQFTEMKRTYREHATTLTQAALDQLTTLHDVAEQELFTAADNFLPQLADYCAEPIEPQANAALQARLKRAGEYYVGKLSQGVLPALKELPTATDNQAVRQIVLAKKTILMKSFFVKLACFKACQTGFSTQAYRRARMNADLDFERQSKADRSQDAAKVPKDSPHPALYQQLLDWRAQSADDQDVRPWEILSNISLADLVARLPSTQRQLLDVQGIGKGKMKRYGDAILAIIKKFVNDNKLTGQTKPRPPSATSTQAKTLELFETGHSIAEIAKLRTLAPSTIEGHLATLIAAGRLKIERVLPTEKIADISSYYSRQANATLTEAKAFFGDKYSFGELRMVASLFSNAGPEPSLPPEA
jgi:hypothetical protein